MGPITFYPVISAALLSMLIAPAAAQRSPAVGWRPAASSLLEASNATGMATARGVVEPNFTWPLLAPAAGWVKQVFFAPGDYVRNRQVLLKFMRNPSYTSELNRDYVLAPRAGIVLRRNVAVGEQVRAGMCVAVVQDVAQVRVPLRVPAGVGQAVRVCDPAVVRVAELPGRTFAGVVELVLAPSSSQPEMQITVVVPNTTAPRIRPRMHATVLLDTHPAPPPVARR